MKISKKYYQFQYRKWKKKSISIVNNLSYGNIVKKDWNYVIKILKVWKIEEGLQVTLC